MGTATTAKYLEPSELVDATRRTSAQARSSGALVPLDTAVRGLSSGGIRFLVRVSKDVQRKQPVTDQHQSPRDPFAPPYEQDLFVGHLSESHAALLNKFNVLDDHLLLITREWEEQAAMLTTADYEAMLIGLAGMDGLAFYNGGAEAGASQPHKHLQLVPLPLADGAQGIPFDDILAGAHWYDASVGYVPALPFRHRIAPFDPDWLQEPAVHAHALRETTERLWRDLGYDPTKQRQPVPYNLLATRRWLWLVPRTTAGWLGLPVNALGYAGALIAQDEDAFQRLVETGPLELLADCAMRSSA